MEQQVKVSVILCTHNPDRSIMDQALDALKQQTMPMNEWEFILLDNKSKPSLEGEVDLSWHSSGSYIREEKIGLTAARLRGIKESRGEYIVFVDDDNLLDPDYLSLAVEVMNKIHLYRIAGWKIDRGVCRQG